MRRFFLGFILGAASIVALLVGIGHFLDVADPLTKADAIVAISGDTGFRAVTAIGLWKQGYAPVLIFSGGSVDPDSVASAELMKRRAVAAGGPAAGLSVGGASATTGGNAPRGAELLKAGGLPAGMLVTKPCHH